VEVFITVRLLLSFFLRFLSVVFSKGFPYVVISAPETIFLGLWIT